MNPNQPQTPPTQPHHPHNSQSLANDSIIRLPANPPKMWFIHERTNELTRSLYITVRYKPKRIHILLYFWQSELQQPILKHISLTFRRICIPIRKNHQIKKMKEVKGKTRVPTKNIYNCIIGPLRCIFLIHGQVSTKQFSNGVVRPPADFKWGRRPKRWGFAYHIINLTQKFSRLRHSMRGLPPRNQFGMGEVRPPKTPFLPTRGGCRTLLGIIIDCEVV